MQNTTANTFDHEPSEEAIKARLSFLMRRYLSSQTKALAQSVVNQLELLLSHSSCIGYPDDRCSYKKMLMQWKALAG